MADKQTLKRIACTTCTTFFVLYLIGLLAGVYGALTHSTEQDAIDAERLIYISVPCLIVFGVLRWGVIPHISFFKSKTFIACPSCGYNLRGLKEAKCPECGAEFTLDQLKLK
jgi:DNA-directed RNA polymerase subunit RPC12/RpoP